MSWRLDALKVENGMLRDALRNANEELRKHRKLIGGLRAGETAVTEQLERVLKASRT